MTRKIQRANDLTSSLEEPAVSTIVMRKARSNYKFVSSRLMKQLGWSTRRWQGLWESRLLITLPAPAVFSEIARNSQCPAVMKTNPPLKLALNLKVEVLQRRDWLESSLQWQMRGLLVGKWGSRRRDILTTRSSKCPPSTSSRTKWSRAGILQSVCGWSRAWMPVNPTDDRACCGYA